MADTKISALSAASAAAAANEFAINEAGTSKKLSGTLLKAFTDPHPVIAGASGAITNVIGVQTLQVLTSDGGDITGTSHVTKMTATGVGTGWWLAEYFLHWNSDATGSGMAFRVTHTGTATPWMATREDMVSSATALATVGVADQDAATTVVGWLPSNWSTRTNAVALGPNAGVDTADVSQLTRITCLFLVTGTGSLELAGASETAAVIGRIQAGTNARYTRLS